MGPCHPHPPYCNGGKDGAKISPISYGEALWKIEDSWTSDKQRACVCRDEDELESNFLSNKFVYFAFIIKCNINGKDLISSSARQIETTH